MIYEHRVTVPASTTENDPVLSTFIVHPGTVKLVSVEFPPGHCGLTHCQILWSEQQLWPSHPEQDFSGDAAVHEFPEEIELDREPLEFTVRAWNNDFLYEHTIIIRMSIIGAGLTLAERLAEALSGSMQFYTKG